MSDATDDMHRHDDVDSSADAHHHTLGVKRHAAMPGDILSGISVDGTDIATLVAAFVKLGATDATP